MPRTYYPYVPWQDDPISSAAINHDDISYVVLPRDSIYGPLRTVLRLLKADVRYLKAIDGKRLAVQQDIRC